MERKRVASREPGAPEREVRVTFAASVYDALHGLARRRGRSVPEVLRDAVAMEQWLEEVGARGGRLLVERDGVLREIRRR